MLVCGFDEDVIGCADALGEHVELSGNGGSYSRSRPAPAEPDAVVRDFKVLLETRASWPFEWTVAKTLAILPPALMRQDVLANWDFLAQRGDLPLIVETTNMIRGVALMRYGKSIEDPAAVTRGVKRLLEAA